MRAVGLAASVASAALLLGGALAGCSGDEPAADRPAGPRSTDRSGEPSSTRGADTAPRRGPRVVGTVARDLSVPWGVAFLPGGDALVTERDTRRVLRVPSGGGEPRQVAVLDQVAPEGESGLLGIAVSPGFRHDHRVFVYLSTVQDNRILRFRYAGGRLRDETVVLDGIPHGAIHDGGRLAFGPDGHLYASTGETGDSALAQDRSSLGGKILRVTQDGDPAPGNPFPGSPVLSYGHRNVQGLAFDDRGRLWASEFGDDTWDELNRIRPGRDYGWPLVEGHGPDEVDGQDLVDPQQVWETSVASPSGLAFLDGSLWMASLRGERLWRVDASGERATDPRAFFVGRYGRMRTVAVTPDGRLWVTTSNRDGRGSPQPRDDRILLVDPEPDTAAGE